jgi:hypothetical protein
MPAFRVLREKATTAGMQEIEQRMEQLPRMRGYENKQLSLFDPVSPTFSPRRVL